MSTWQYEYISECTSTNLHIKELRKSTTIADKTAILSDFQTMGKGQGKNRWHSAPGKNMLCSFYKEINLKAEDHFLLNMLVSLSIVESLAELDLDARVKWPNDIYIGDKKTAGILIENSLMQSSIINTIIGIGLNVNQKKFPDWIPNPVSISQISNKQFEVKQVAQSIGGTLIRNIEHLESLEINKQDVLHKYLGVLYRINQWHIFQKDGHNFNGMIHGVLPDGRLIVETGGGKIHHFSFGEVGYVI